MPSLTPTTLRKQIKSGTVAPVYLVLGDDEYEKTELASEFEDIVDEEIRAFNVERLHGGDVRLSAVLDALRTLPMMAPRRVVIVLRAERLLNPKRENKLTMQDLDAFEQYLDAPAVHATLVLVAADLDERRRISKRLLSRATIVRCGELNDVADAKRWIRTRVTAAGKQIEPEALRFLSELVGPDLGRLRGEVDRLLLFATDKPSIAITDVKEVAGPAAVYDDWAVARAIERGATKVALRELALALEAGAVPHMVLGQLAWVVRTRLLGVRVPAAVDSVFRTDLALKRSAGEPRVLLERLVVELCGATRIGSGASGN